MMPLISNITAYSKMLLNEFKFREKMGRISKEANYIFNNLENNDIKVLNEGNEKIKKYKKLTILEKIC